MIRLFFILCALFIFGCESKSKNETFREDAPESDIAKEISESVDQQGTVIATLALQNIPYHLFFFKITQVLLVDSISNKSVSLTTPSNIISIDYSSMEKKSLILAVNKHIPAGVYDRVILLVSMENSVITASNQLDRELPLVDAALNSIPEERANFTIESYIGNKEKITIEPEGVQLLEISFDIDASTKYVPLPQGKLGVMFTPQIRAKIQTNKNPVQLIGEVEKITDKHLTLLHPYKVQPQKPEYTMNYAFSDKDAGVFYDGRRDSHLAAEDSEYWAYIDTDLNLTKTGFDVTISNAFLLKKQPGLKLFQGVIVEGNERKMTLSGLYLDSGYSGYPLQRKLMNKTFTFSDSISLFYKGNIDPLVNKIEPTAGQKVWVIIDPTALIIKSMFIKPSRILGRAEKDADSQLRIRPLSYNNVDALSANYSRYYPQTLTINDTTSSFSEDQLIDMTGYQIAGNQASFIPIKSQIVPENTPLIFSISTPAIPVVSEMVLNAKGQLTLALNPEIHEGKAFLKIRYPESNAQFRSASKIKNILVDQPKGRQLSVLIDGTDPVQSFHFDENEAFYHFINEKLSSDSYLFNEINFSGVLEGGMLKASKISIVFINKETVNTERTPYDDDDDSTPTISTNRNSKFNNFLMSAMPIMVPLGATLLVTSILSTISGLFDGAYSAVQLSTHRKEMRELIVEAREERAKGFINEMNKQYEGTEEGKFKTIENIFEGGSDKEKFQALKNIIENNRKQLEAIRDSGSAKSNVDKFIRMHYVLLTYLEGFDEIGIKENILNADERYKALVTSSNELHESLKNYINQSVFKTNKGEVIGKISSYTDNLHDIIFENGKQILTEDAIKKTHPSISDELRKEFHKVRSLKPRI